jgi:hypothetical protein
MTCFSITSEEIAGVDWSEPWSFQLSGLEKELEKELIPGHALHGRTTLAVARHEGRDDILFLVDDEAYPLAVVHLTWARETDPRWPYAERYSSIQEFLDHRLIPDSKEYTEG